MCATGIDRAESGQPECPISVWTASKAAQQPLDLLDRGQEARVASRRAGDPSRLVADSTRAREVLGWNPQFPEIEKIIETAWAWHEAHPRGYE